MTVRAVVRQCIRPAVVGGEVLGPELIVNGSFGADTDWTKGTGWTISAGVATKVPSSVTALRQVVAAGLVAGWKYRLVFTMTRTAGILTPQLQGGSTVSGTARSAAGTYTEDITAGAGNVNCYFSANATFDGTVDNVSLKQVLT